MWENLMNILRGVLQNVWVSVPHRRIRVFSNLQDAPSRWVAIRKPFLCHHSWPTVICYVLQGGTIIRVGMLHAIE